MKKSDFILIITVILASILSFFLISRNSEKGDSAVIYKNGSIYMEVELLKDAQIDIGGTNTATIENGEIYMSHSDCPDKLCMHQGKISDSSKKIICLPNKVVIEVKKKSGIDAVVR